MAQAVHRFPRPWHRETVYESETDEAYAERDYRTSVVARVVWFVAGVIIALLAFRFIFALLGANPNNGIAQFVYSVSHPFVAPFFGLFSYTNQLQYGVSRFEIYTLVAILAYAVIAYGLARLATIGRRY